MAGGENARNRHNEGVKGRGSLGGKDLQPLIEPGHAPARNVEPTD
jgi:hypothetical protein